MCLTLAGKNFTEQYQSLDPDVYYVKLDDDTMYVGEQAIDMMLHEKLRDRFFIVSANVINHSGIHWLMQYLMPCRASYVMLQHICVDQQPALQLCAFCMEVFFGWRLHHKQVVACTANNPCVTVFMRYLV